MPRKISDRKYILSNSVKNAQFARLMAKFIDISIFFILVFFLKWLGALIGIVYLSIADYIYDGQSLGKRFFGIRVVSLIDAKPCTPGQSFVRNLPIVAPLLFSLIPVWGLFIGLLLLLPFVLLEVYLILKLDSSHRFGDVMADTTVVANTSQLSVVQKEPAGWFTTL